MKANNKTSTSKKVNERLEKTSKDCNQNDDPCDNSIHWIGKMICNEEK